MVRYSPIIPDFNKSNIIQDNNIIKVIGVGGGGSNAVSSMYKRGIQGVSFIICNTDEQALRYSQVPNQLQIGIDLTHGLGAGANPEVGKNAAIESKDEIEALLQDNTKMVFITAGMGGGTGTGAAPVIASIANKLGILTVGIVTMPFAFEGRKKILQAQEGVLEMKKHCDTVIVILNDKLREVLGEMTISNAFAQADNVLTTAAKSIAEIITVPGYVNVDFEDVKTVMKKAGTAVMGSAQVDGENRAQRAAEMALDSPLLNYRNVKGAKKILLSIVSGVDSELQMDELSLIADYIQEQVGCDAEMIFGHSIDKQLQDGIRVTLIATGFDDNKEDTNESAFYSQSVKSQRKNSERTENRVEKNKEEEGDESEFDINDNKMLTEFYSTPAYKRCDVQLLSKENY
jgi:cell division protein FtsZ